MSSSILVCFALLLIFSCNQNTDEKIADRDAFVQTKIDSILLSENFNPNIDYEPISLFCKGKPLFTPGQSIVDVDTILSFSRDVNHKYWNKSYAVIDYLTLDNDLSTNLSDGSLNGIAHFSVDTKNKQIFNISACWLVDCIDLNDSLKHEIKQKFPETFFPALEGKFELSEDWSYQIDKKEYVEYFEVESPQERDSPWWLISYHIEMK